MSATRSSLGQRTAAAWKPLQLFNGYRLLVVALFLTVWLGGIQTRELGQSAPRLYAVTLIAYAVIALLALLANHQRWPHFTTQVATLATIDILVVLLLLYASGGIDSGLAVLLIPIVGAVGILMPGIAALFAAAAASLLLLFEQIYLFLVSIQDDRGYTPAGLLGLALFATALLASYLARHARASERLAEHRGVDLANLTELNQRVIEQLDSGVLVVDAHQRVRFLNQRAGDLLATHVNTGQPLARLAPELARHYHDWTHDPATETRILTSSHYRLRVHFSPLGADRRAVLITLEDQAEVTAQIQLTKLAALGRLTASIAHEIRNPLTGISHAAQLLGESARIDPTDQRLTTIIRQQSDRLNAIIEDILRLSRKEPPKRRCIDLTRWLPTYIDTLRAQLELDEGQCALHILPDTPLPIDFDEGHLMQILSGLCANASLHGRNTNGQVEIRIRALRQADATRLDVTDRGAGVAPEHQPHLFEPFFTTATSGTGLGLYIARELAELNQASLEYHSLPEDGACFRLRFEPARSHQPIGLY